MKSVYIRELQKYSKEQLSTLFDLPISTTDKLIKDLKFFNVIKVVSTEKTKKDISELSEADLAFDYAANTYTNCLYVFDYVGIILCYGLIIKCFPKYIKSKVSPLDEMKQVIKVLQKYKSKTQNINYELDYDIDSQTLNRLPIILYLLDDYQKNGIYTKSEDVINNDPNYEILWDKTISDTDPFFDGNTPYYLDIKSRKRFNDENNYLSLLHKFILTQCSEELKDSELPELFPDLTTVFLSDSKFEDFGDVDYILNMIEKELNVQFNTQKQMLLKSLYAYISNTKSLNDDDTYAFYGTNKFNIVWEEVCKTIFDDKLDTTIKNLGVPSLHSSFTPNLNDTLISLIEKPEWQDPTCTKIPEKSDKTFIPDIVTIDKNNFIILDAKYYNFVLEYKRLEGYPGIESVSKQYFYQMAFKDFISLNGFSNVYNCFLFPVEGDVIVDKGTVILGFLRRMMLADIHLKLLSANIAFETYLNNKKIPLSVLHIK